MMKTWITRLTLAIGLGAPLVAAAYPLVSAGSATTQPGATFELAIAIDFVAADPGVSAWQFDLTYDPTVLQANEVVEGDFLARSGLTLFEPGVIDPLAGTITLVTDAWVDIGDPPHGAGDLAFISFTALRPGSSRIGLGNTFLNFSDSAFVTRDGTVTVAASVPEPLTIASLLAGGALLAGAAWRRRRASGVR